jgi:hypothetical protein
MCDRVLDLCEEWDDWTPIGAWVEMHDFIHRVGNTQIRTTITYRDQGGKPEHTRRTLKKAILQLKDYSYVSTLGGVPRTGMLSADVRVALSEETQIGEDDVPASCKDRQPIRVRIKQRRSFHYTPKGASLPVWRFDFTLVWSAVSIIVGGLSLISCNVSLRDSKCEFAFFDILFFFYTAQKSLKKAQQKQIYEEPNFELECELIDPWDYLQHEPDDAVVAKVNVCVVRIYSYFCSWRL